jgi:hypothetical protein
MIEGQEIMGGKNIVLLPVEGQPTKAVLAHICTGVFFIQICMGVFFIRLSVLYNFCNAFSSETTTDHSLRNTKVYSFILQCSFTCSEYIELHEIRKDDYEPLTEKYMWNTSRPDNIKINVNTCDVTCCTILTY